MHVQKIIAVILLSVTTLLVASCKNQSSNRYSQILFLASADGGITTISTIYDMSDTIQARIKGSYHSRRCFDVKRATDVFIPSGQGWNTREMFHSTASGADNLWFTDDDTFAMAIFIESTKSGDTVNTLYYSDVGKTTMIMRVGYLVEGVNQVKSLIYDAGPDTLLNTFDDTVSSSSVYSYNSLGEIETITSYNGNEETFKSVTVYTYDGNNRLVSVRTYEDEARTTMLAGSLYFDFIWSPDGFMVACLGGTQGFGYNQMRYEMHFNGDGTTQKIVSYDKGSDNIFGTIDDSISIVIAQYIYENGRLKRYNVFSDDEITQTGYLVMEYQ